MNDLFATIYEWFFYDQDYQSVFDELYNGDFLNLYSSIGLITLLTSIFAAVIFYFMIKNPWLKWWHWLLWGFFWAFIVVGGVTYGTCNNGLYAISQDAQYEEFVSVLIWKLVLFNSLISFMLYVMCGFLFKTKSKAQSHLPF